MPGSVCYSPDTYNNLGRYYSRFRDYEIKTQNEYLASDHKGSTTVRPGALQTLSETLIFTWFIKIQGLCSSPNYGRPAFLDHTMVYKQIPVSMTCT